MKTDMMWLSLSFCRERIEMSRVCVYPVMGGIRQHPWGAETAGKACCAFNSQVDRAFLVEVLLTSRKETAH